MISKEESKVKTIDLVIRLLKDWQMTEKVTVDKGRVLTVDPTLGEKLIKDGTAELYKKQKVK